MDWTGWRTCVELWIQLTSPLKGLWGPRVWTERGQTHRSARCLPVWRAELTALCVFSVPCAPTPAPAMRMADVCGGGCRADAGHVPREAAAVSPGAPPAQPAGAGLVRDHRPPPGAAGARRPREGVADAGRPPGHLLGPLPSGHSAPQDTGHLAGWVPGTGGPGTPGGRGRGLLPGAPGLHQQLADGPEMRLPLTLGCSLWDRGAPTWVGSSGDTRQ